MFAKKYPVDYCGQKGSFTGAKDAFREGEEVTLYYSFIATDTDYSFYVEGAEYKVDYCDKGYRIRFVMPPHGVRVRCESRNSMLCMDFKGY